MCKCPKCGCSGNWVIVDKLWMCDDEKCRYIKITLNATDTEIDKEFVIEGLEEVMNILGGPVMGYCAEIAMKEYDEKISKAVQKLIEIRKRLKK